MDFVYLNLSEVATVYFIGFAFLLTGAYLLRLKFKTVLILSSNSIIGSCAYILLAIFTQFTLKLSALNIFVCGISGMLGTLLLSILNIFI